MIGVFILVLASGLAQVTKPSDLKFPAPTYEPPDPKAFRTVWPANGLRAYVQEDRSLPAGQHFRLDRFRESMFPKARRDWICSADTLIRGGTKTREGASIEERIDFLGGSLTSSPLENDPSLQVRPEQGPGRGLGPVLRRPDEPRFPRATLRPGQGPGDRATCQANDQPGMIRIGIRKAPVRPACLDPPADEIILGECHPRPTLKRSMPVISSRVTSSWPPRGIFQGRPGGRDQQDHPRAWKDGSPRYRRFPSRFRPPEPGVYFIQKPINQATSVSVISASRTPTPITRPCR